MTDKTKAGETEADESQAPAAEDPRTGDSRPEGRTRPEDMPTGDEDSATQPTGGAGRWGVTTISIVTLGAFIIALTGLKEIANIVMPAFFALNLVIAAQPLQALMLRRGLPRWLASLITLLVLYLVLAALVGMLVWSVWIAAEELPNYLDKFTDFYNQAIDQLGRFGVSADQVQSSLKGIDPQTIMSGVTTFAGQLSSFGSQLLVLFIAVTFLAFDIPGIAVRSGTIRRWRPRLADSLVLFNHGICNYWIVSTVFGLIVAVMDVAALWFLDIPLAVVWGVLSFVTNYIPNVGFVLGLIPPAAFALFTGGPMTMLWVIVAYCVINFVMQSLIQPKFTGDAVGLNASVTFLSLVFWSAVAGPLGAILAVPMTLAVKALFLDPDPQMQWLSTFLTSNGAEEKQQEHLRSRKRTSSGEPHDQRHGREMAEGLTETS